MDTTIGLQSLNTIFEYLLEILNERNKIEKGGKACLSDKTSNIYFTFCRFFVFKNAFILNRMRLNFFRHVLRIIK